MSELLQSGQHPDADQLNAFVEHALPAHEQQETLAHLAVCTTCRQIVALSLPPGDAPTARQPEVGRRWFPRWHPVWAGIPAFAALILAIFLLRNGGMTTRQRSAPTQTADAHLPAAAPAMSPPPEAAREAEPLAQRSNPKRALAARNAPSPRTPATRQLLPGDASGFMGGVISGLASQPGLAPQQQESSSAARSASVAGPMQALTVDRAQAVFLTQSPLPSHLAILSMASQAEQRVAIDTENQLFFSDDAGRNWKTVPSPWKGHAVRVALTSSVPFGSAAFARKTSSAPVAATGATLSGTITDPAGGVISGATVVATNSSGAAVSNATTDKRGQFRMEGLATGGYRIQAQATGFLTQSVAAEVTASHATVADITLRVGAASQTVTVEASPAPPLETSPAGGDLAANPMPQSRFVLTTDDGERWTSSDGLSWSRE